jgi:hypothetical protein
MKFMPHPIRVDNSRPATVRDTARLLGVSKSRTDELIREVRRMIHKDARTGEFVIRTSNSSGDGSRNGSTKNRKTNSTRRKTSR